MSNIRQRAINGIKPGDVFTFSRTFSEQDTEAFGDLTRDYNPVHYDQRWFQSKGYDGLICHGLLIGGMICQIGGQLGWLATGMDFRFIKAAYFGDTITCSITIIELDASGRAKSEAVLTNQRNEVVVKAVMTGLLPTPQERKLLQTMVDEGDPTNKLSA